MNPYPRPGTVAMMPSMQNGEVDLIPVRCDGSGRLVAVGLVRTVGVDGEESWTTIGGDVLPEETIEEAIARRVAETLGPAARARLVRLPQVGMAGQPDLARFDDASLHTDQRDSEAAYAVEIHGRLVPQPPALRFAWFLVTAMPIREEVSVAQWALLADFLEAWGEPRLAARMRQF